MLDELRFVQGAVARKDLGVPGLSHFCIKDKRVIGYNGAIALSSPIDVTLSCAPKAAPFLAAIRTCKDTIELHITPNGRLSVRSGRFNAFVDCLEDQDYPRIAPEGETVKLGGGILEALASLAPFIAVDASRPWARGILFRGASAYATNNIIVAERWLGYQFPLEINIPEEAVSELLRIGDEPTHLQVSENSITFHFEGGRWLRSQLLTTAWPDVSPILNRPSNPSPLPAEFFSALEDISPFTDDQERVFFLPDAVSTVPEGDTGAKVLVTGIPGGGCYNIKQVRHLEGIVKEIDLTLYPDPCLFFGDKLRGAIVGMRF